jgi:glutathione S-transferase
MKLYYAPGACSLAVHIALREVGAMFEIVRVDPATHRLADGGDYLAIAPRGYVPLLELADGSRHTETAALLQYVAEREGSNALIGKPGAARRLQVIEWLAFISTELHKTFGLLWNRETPDAMRTTAKQTINRRFTDLERHLAHHDHLAGAFSVADAYAFTVVNWANVVGLTLDTYPRLRAYLARIWARPHVKAALRAEGLVR